MSHHQGEADEDDEGDHQGDEELAPTLEDDERGGSSRATSDGADELCEGPTRTLGRA